MYATDLSKLTRFLSLFLALSNFPLFIVNICGTHTRDKCNSKNSLNVVGVSL